MQRSEIIITVYTEYNYEIQMNNNNNKALFYSWTNRNCVH